MAKKSATTPTPPPPPKPNPTAEALIQHGFAHNAGLLDINGSLQVGGMELPYPWSLPSRMFQFPIEVGRQREDGTRQLTIRHPMLDEHPLVLAVEEKLGIVIEYDDTPGNYGEWWHAVDLVSRGKWRELLATAQFTTPEHIAGAVTYGLRYSAYEGKKRQGHISIPEAREIMAYLESPEPADWRGVIRKHFMTPTVIKEEKGGERWPINIAACDMYADDLHPAAWGMILGIEHGWFAHDRAGFLGWAAKGREQFPKIDASAIAPRPTGAAVQLDLF